MRCVAQRILSEIKHALYVDVFDLGVLNLKTDLRGLIALLGKQTLVYVGVLIAQRQTFSDLLLLALQLDHLAFQVALNAPGLRPAFLPLLKQIETKHGQKFVGRL